MMDGDFYPSIGWSKQIPFLQFIFLKLPSWICISHWNGLSKSISILVWTTVKGFKRDLGFSNTFYGKRKFSQMLFQRHYKRHEKALRAPFQPQFCVSSYLLQSIIQPFVFWNFYLIFFYVSFKWNLVEWSHANLLKIWWFVGKWNDTVAKQREMETEWVKLPYMAMSVVILSILLVTSFSASHRLVYRVRWVLWWLYH